MVQPPNNRDQMRTSSRCLIFSLLAALSVMQNHAASAEDVKQFYAGKQITLFVGTSAGGGYDLYARTLAQFLPAHIPGHPTIIVQNRPGSSGLGLASSVYNALPKDGTVLAMSPVSMVMAEVLEPDTLNYKSAKFGWVGTMSTTTDILAVFKPSGVNTIEDAKHKQVVIAAGNKFGNPGIYPAVSNVLLGTKFKIVLGYPGATEAALAMERGEVDGRTNQWDSWNAQRPDWVREGKLSYLFQVGPKVPDLASVPTLAELLNSQPQYRSVMDLLEVGQLMGRSVYVAPGVPAERLAALRAAFDATMTDPSYIAQMKRAGFDMLHRKGVELQADLERAMNNTEAVASELRRIIDTQYR
jgi:tripartite-type tricarboxylate transporter receptor subunit TctC